LRLGVAMIDYTEPDERSNSMGLLACKSTAAAWLRQVTKKSPLKNCRAINLI